MRVILSRRSIGAVVVLVGIVSGCSNGADSGGFDIEPVGSDVEVVDRGAASSSAASARPPLFDFNSPDSVTGWNVVNDTVMGGVSSGRLDVADGSLIFSGELSLDNNGGFASVRGPVIEPRTAAAWSKATGPRIVAEGDGRTWTVEVRTVDESGGWIAPLPTSADSITEVNLPWVSFEPVTRFLDPRVADAPLDPSRIVSIAVYLVDGVEGPFRLRLLSIS